MTAAGCRCRAPLRVSSSSTANKRAQHRGEGNRGRGCWIHATRARLLHAAGYPASPVSWSPWPVSCGSGLDLVLIQFSPSEDARIGDSATADAPPESLSCATAPFRSVDLIASCLDFNQAVAAPSLEALLLLELLLDGWCFAADCYLDWRLREKTRWKKTGRWSLAIGYWDCYWLLAIGLVVGLLCRCLCMGLCNLRRRKMRS